MMLTFRTFDTKDEAISYRRRSGCGGWIFSSPNAVILFPPSMTAMQVMLHPLSRGLSGELIP